MSARIVLCAVGADGHIQVLIPYKLYRQLVRFIPSRRVQQAADEVVADALREYLRSQGAE